MRKCVIVFIKWSSSRGARKCHNSSETLAPQRLSKGTNR